MGSLGTPQQQPCATEARTKEEERTGEESATSGETHHHHHHHHAEVSPAGSGYGNDRQTRRGGETVISRGGGTILVDNRNDQVVDCQQQQPQQVPVIAVEEDSEEGVAIGEPESDDIMGNALGFKSEKSSSGESVQAASREIPRIAVIEASPLPVAAADGSMFDLPAGLYHHCVCGGAGNDGSTTSEVEQGPASRRRNSTGSQHSLRSGHLSDDDDDECHSSRGGGGSLSGSDNDNGAATPRSASRQNFIELMMNNSPQVRRSMQAHRNSAYLSRCNDGDSSSVASSSLAGDEYRAPVALDPLEHAWMMCASDGEWAGLAALLADEPALLLRRDFVTGFTCLHWAAKLGRAELLALVVNFARRHQVPVDVDVRSGAGGYTPLHLAAMHGHADVLKLLVGAYGADVEVRDYSGRKACQYLTDNNATIDLREIIAGASAERDSDTAADGAGGAAGGARRRLSNALVDVLNPLRLLHHHHNDDGDDEATDGQSSKRRDKPVRRKSSLSGKMRPKLQRLRDRTSQIVHSVSFHDAEDLGTTRSDRRGGSFRSSRPKSNLFG